MNLSRRTWIAAVKLAAVLSVLAAVAAVVASSIVHLPDLVIIAGVVVVAFTASWVQTGRIRHQADVTRPVPAATIAGLTTAA
ncbi:MAG: hypothetical protein AAFP84_22825 [Actinomycetota bacterium]